MKKFQNFIKNFKTLLGYIPLLMFFLSIAALDSEPFYIPLITLIISFGICLIQLYMLCRGYREPKERTAKDYSKDFADLCLKYETISAPERKGQI